MKGGWHLLVSWAQRKVTQKTKKNKQIQKKTVLHCKTQCFSIRIIENLGFSLEGLHFYTHRTPKKAKVQGNSLIFLSVEETGDRVGWLASGGLLGPQKSSPKNKKNKEIQKKCFAL